MKCGTYSGVGVHRRKREPLCELCRSAAREYDRQWRAKNPDAVARYKKTEYAEHYDAIRERAKRYIAANREKDREWGKRYRDANPEKARERVRRRRARRLMGECSPYTEAEVLASYGTDCSLCSLPIDMTAPRSTSKDGWQRGLHIDHVIPIAHGGPDTLENVRPAHGLCNVSKGASLLLAGERR